LLRRAVVLAWALVLAAPPALATQVRPLNLEEMTDRAARIFYGRCIFAEAVHDPVLGADVTVLTFAVIRAVKGDSGGRVTVRMLRTDDSGLPRFRPGEEVVIFLYGESRLGLSSPVGLDQGKFSVSVDKLGRRIAVNSLGNRTLFRGLSSHAAERLGPAVQRWQDRNSILAETLLDLVESLVTAELGEPRGPGR